MIRRPPRSTRTDTLFPYTTLFRSASKQPASHTDLLPAEIPLSAGMRVNHWKDPTWLMQRSTPIRPSRPEAAILVILENTSGTGWLLLTIAHARNDVPQIGRAHV